MKIIILFTIFLFNISSHSQCSIQLNPASCNGSNALIVITSGEIYDQYQWYFKPINSAENFQIINGATFPSLTCDWATYDQTEIKLECYYDGTPVYFSNTIDLDFANCSLGLGESSEMLEMILSPNPVKDYILLRGFDSSTQIEIFNSIGQNVFTSKNLTFNTINASFLQPGIYILRAMSGETIKVIKFIKS
jgi:hypothetical protein